MIYEIYDCKARNLNHCCFNDQYIQGNLYMTVLSKKTS
uniref:Uncharacterized protein n=1 Tax=Arundo donax TaxID=35708 RepID=A0A0A9C1D3_ARUDO